MKLDFLLAMAQNKAQIKKAFEDTRLDLLLSTLDRLTTKETLENELEKSVQNFITKQSELDAISCDMSALIVKAVKEEIMEMLTSPDEITEPASYDIKIPR